MNKQNKDGIPIRCDCGKLIAMCRQGKVYIKCKGCKREIELNVVQSQEPKSQEP